MAKYQVLFARFPGGGKEDPTSSDWVMSAVKQASLNPDIGWDGIKRWHKSDTPITMVRNLAVRSALEKGFDYLCMIDSDMEPDYLVGEDPTAKPFWDVAWEHMMAHRDRPCAIAAPYCGPPPHENVFVFHWANFQSDHPNPDFKLVQYTREHAAILTGVTEVAALPTGLILYDMRVFKKLAKPWFAYEYADDFQSAKSTTEDVYQTRNQSLSGMPVYCAWDSWAVHNKTKRVGKPRILPVDAVGKDMRQAVERKIESGDRLVYLKPPQSNGHAHREEVAA